MRSSSWCSKAQPRVTHFRFPCGGAAFGVTSLASALRDERASPLGCLRRLPRTRSGRQPVGSALAPQFVEYELNEGCGGNLSKVDVADRGSKAWELGVVEPCRQHVFGFLVDGSRKCASKPCRRNRER
jgi:hypothetical protein